MIRAYGRVYYFTGYSNEETVGFASQPGSLISAVLWPDADINTLNDVSAAPYRLSISSQRGVYKCYLFPIKYPWD